MLAIFLAAALAATNAVPDSDVRFIPSHRKRRADMEGSSLIERRNYYRMQGGNTNEVWRETRRFPLMFSRGKSKQKKEQSK